MTNLTREDSEAPLSIFSTGPVGLNYCAECADTEPPPLHSTPLSSVNICPMLSISVACHSYLLMYSLHYLQHPDPEPLTTFICNLELSISRI